MISQTMERALGSPMQAEKRRWPQTGGVVTLNDKVKLMITQSSSRSSWPSSKGVPAEPLERHRAKRTKEHEACDNVSVAVVA